MIAECDICGEDLELNEVDGMHLCNDCECDYYNIDLPDPKVLRFHRDVHMNLYYTDRRWRFSYSIRFMGGKSHKIRFRATNAQYKAIRALETPLFWIGRQVRKYKRRKQK